MGDAKCEKILANAICCIFYIKSKKSLILGTLSAHSFYFKERDIT